MKNLDESDFEIVRLLEKNAEFPYQRIAEMLGLSLTTVYNRVKRLKRIGVIQRTVVEVDYLRLGYSIRALVGVSLSPKAQDQALTKLRKMGQVRRIYQVTGRFDYMLEVVVRHTEELRRLLTEEMGKIEAIQRTETMVIIHSE
jgi:DNA-binding Lrp family transcriptional regulator